MYEDHKTTITGSGDLRIDDESNEEEPKDPVLEDQPK
jgi:hypothetical protein